MADFVPAIIIFCILALAANQIGHSIRQYSLPMISGYLFVGMIVGPFALGLLTKEAIAQLRFVDEVSLAIIAFAAGNELYLKELRSRLRSIAYSTVGLVVATFTFGIIAMMVLADYVPFMKEMPWSGRLAVALLGSAILIARSPSSAIAVVNELRARGRFTQTVLGVTVIMDVLVILLFAINSEIADAIFTEVNFNVMFILLVVGELLVSFLFAYVVSLILTGIMSLSRFLVLKPFLVLGLGFGVYRLSAFIRTWTHEYLPFEILLEPLLICMVASFLVTNRSRHRNELTAVLNRIAQFIYVLFFTLTGASLALDVIVIVWPVAICLFAIRLLGIFAGTWIGGTLAGDPASHNRAAWMAYVTQAGVGLGLAKEVVVEFPEIGQSFAAMMIAVIIINQLVGPILFKLAIFRVGEAHLPGPDGEPDEQHSAVLFGLNPRSLALATQLTSHNWQVKIATLAPPEEDPVGVKVEIYHLKDWTYSEMQKLDLHHTKAIVALKIDDEQNFQICQLAYEKFGVENIVVELHNRARRQRFRELDALIVEPETAVVSLLDHFVRSPTGTTMLLGMQEGHDVVDVVLSNTNLAGLAVHEIRLPQEVLILAIHRSNETLVPRGQTLLHIGDKLTIAGPDSKIQEVMVRMES